jgi:hypothetical protein
LMLNSIKAIIHGNDKALFLLISHTGVMAAKMIAVKKRFDTKMVSQ